MVNPDPRIATVANKGSEAQYMPLVWLKFLLRLRQLPDGVHSVVVIKSGDACQWSVQMSGKAEG
ncbi:MAG: hypothetical protein WBO46_27285 [Caldilineaceae bacterium]